MPEERSVGPPEARPAGDQGPTGASVPPSQRIAVLAASAFVVLAAEPLFLLVDTAVVGHLGRLQLAALGAGSTVMGLLAIVGTSLEYGTTARAARLFGAGDRGAAVAEGVQASWLALLIGLVATGLGEVAAGPVCRLIAGDGGVAAAGASWLHVALLGLPGVLLILAANGWLRGVQDIRTPVRIVVVANALSAIASPVLVYPLGMGLTGSAVANVVAQWTGAALSLWALRRENVSGRPILALMTRQIVVGRDLVLRSVAFQAAYLSAAGAAGRMGAAQLAAHQVGLQLWELVALMLDSFAIAAQSLVGAALGAGNAAAARSTAWRVGRYGLSAGSAFAALTAVGWSVLPAVFTGDDGVRDQAHVLWPWLVAMMPVAGVVFALDGVLLGAGDNAYIRSVTLVGVLGGFVPMCWAALQFDLGLGGIWAGLALFISIRFIAMVHRTRGEQWLRLGTGTGP